MIKIDVDHSLFYCGSFEGCINLIVYVNDIFIFDNNKESIVELKLYLAQKFQTNDLGHLGIFLDIEKAQSKDDLIIFQRK